MEKMKIKSPMHRGSSPGQKFSKPSLTVPGMAMTIAEMFVKFQQGITMDADGRLVWEDEEYDQPLPVLNDLTELDDLKLKNKAVIDRYTKARSATKSESLIKDPDKPAVKVAQRSELSGESDPRGE